MPEKTPEKYASKKGFNKKMTINRQRRKKREIFYKEVVIKLF